MERVERAERVEKGGAMGSARVGKGQEARELWRGRRGCLRVEKGGEGGAYKIPGAFNPLAYLNAGTCSIMTHSTAHDLFTA